MGDSLLGFEMCGSLSGPRAIQPGGTQPARQPFYLCADLQVWSSEQGRQCHLWTRFLQDRVGFAECSLLDECQPQKPTGMLWAKGSDRKGLSMATYSQQWVCIAPQQLCTYHPHFIGEEAEAHCGREICLTHRGS